MSSFERLSPALQYQIVNGLGFRELRPVQLLSIDAILDGKNCVVLAPTAGGKTEAAFFPLLSRMETEDWRPVSTIYVAPIRALLNNQEERLARYAALIGRRSFKWHGDTSDGERRKFMADPADILLTTPESLEVMMISSKVPAPRLFQNLRAVVVDEIHAFVGDDRGGHLASLLERLSRFCGHDVQRIGLSATVGNPEEILDWQSGSSKREKTLVRPPPEGRKADLALDYVGSVENAARVIEGLHPGKKRLVFADSRRRVESLGASLRALGVDTFVTHSSLSADERAQAERAFTENSNCVIVATSALELGIDIGDLDHVLQVDAPTNVASFLQRMGRTGRRDGTTPNCTFLATDDQGLLRAAALLRLHAAGFVEPVRPRRAAAHLLAHQILALCLQEGGIPESDWWGWVSQATPFQDLTDADRQELLAHMLHEGILISDGGRLSLGPRGEKLYGFRNFGELYAVFSVPRILKVLYGSQEVGSIEADFAEQNTPRGPLTFTLGAKAWRATHIDWNHGVVHVEPSDHFASALWRGEPFLMHEPLCRAIKDILTSTDDDPTWSRRAREQMTAIRGEHAFLRDGASLIPEGPGYRLWTFAGGRANNLLARVLESTLASEVTSNNLYIGLKEGSLVAVHQALDGITESGRPNEADALRFVSEIARSRLSKFEPCLPPNQQERFLASVLTDAATAREAARGTASRSPVH